ncbi:MAG: hypothetical protein UX41_C0011G0007 [Candidatus Collierbacteria bacterium GW2011_GWE1_46_18]|uniref:Glycosyl transferase family 1 domain-containing protein n=1 Tax=Candidatus Collierbacteria bacterium GW2011_GWE1_46_18 TaxID=1618399 RepID=A0A0G1S954_9BACT|nr:MAG: hypothetical protein UX41_C0011G0007 [Candidatus Collierbacteria bacterium GW2011_GWE1_46_18]HBD95956.1 hypothetical protein [Spirochaetia bacterium]
MNKKIAFICLGSGSQAISGTEIQLFCLAKQLAKYHKQQIVFITAKNTTVPDEKTNIIHLSNIDLKKNIKNYILFPFMLYKSLLSANADIYISSAAGIESGLISMFCIVYRKHYIFRTASSIDCTNEKISQLGYFVGWFYKYCLKHADIIVTQSITDQTNLLKYHHRNSIVIKNGIHIPDNRSKIANKKYILWVGSCRKVKQPEIFIDLAKKIENEIFLMIMPKSSDLNYWNSVYKKIITVKNLRYIERVDQNQIQKYFDLSKILIGTSKYEGFPNVYIQACLASIPIVSLSVNPDGFISKYNLGLYSNGDINILKMQVEELLNNHKMYKEMSDNAYDYLISNHDIFMIGKQWKEIINNI